MDPALVVLWFGRELLLADATGVQSIELPDRGDDVGALVKVIEGLSPAPREVRLIYHPADLEQHAAECAQGRRSVVRETLGDSHPALRRPQTVWAVSRLQPTENGHSTLLWIEARPRLRRLREALAARGVRLVGAWPLASLFEETPPTDQIGEPALAVLLTDGGGVVYAVTPGGVRTMVWSLGPEHRTQVGGLLRNALSHFAADSAPPVLVVDGGSEPWNLGVGPLAGLTPSTMGLDQFLSAAHQLRPSSLADFIPQQTTLKLDAVLTAVAAAAALAAFLVGALYFAEYRRLQGDAKVRRGLAEQLHADLSRLQANARTAAELHDFEEESKVSAGGRVALLFAVIEHKPAELTVHSLSLNGRAFEIIGTAHEGGGPASGPYQRFVTALSADPQRWQLAPESRAAPGTPGRFSITGTFP